MSHCHIFLCISLSLPVTLHVHNFQRLQDHNSQQLFRGDKNRQYITNDLFLLVISGQTHRESYSKTKKNVYTCHVSLYCLTPSPEDTLLYDWSQSQINEAPTHTCPHFPWWYKIQQTTHSHLHFIFSQIFFVVVLSNLLFSVWVAYCKRKAGTCDCFSLSLNQEISANLILHT